MVSQPNYQPARKHLGRKSTDGPWRQAAEPESAECSGRNETMGTLALVQAQPTDPRVSSLLFCHETESGVLCLVWGSPVCEGFTGLTYLEQVQQSTIKMPSAGAHTL